MAGSVNSNPVVIRRILSMLNKAGMITTQRGVEGGATLRHEPEQISLLDVYRVTEQGRIFVLHRQEPNPLCPCGRTIKPILTKTFQQAESAMEAVLADKTIADIVAQIEAEGEPE